jgi:peptidoglycan/LPS O-acetylase OafA/YrhL
MQAQREKTTPARKLSVGELVVALLNLLVAAPSGILAFSFLISSGFALFGGGVTIIFLSSLGTSLLLFLRQRKLAAYAQSIAVVGVLGFCGILLGTNMQRGRGNGFPTQEALLITLPLGVVALIFAWFAWFLKRMVESE